MGDGQLETVHEPSDRTVALVPNRSYSSSFLTLSFVSPVGVGLSLRLYDSVLRQVEQEKAMTDHSPQPVAQAEPAD